MSEEENEARAGSGRSAQRGGGSGFQVAKLFGVHIFVDWSLIIIFALILVNLGGGVLPTWHPDWGPLLIWMTALVAAVLFFVSILAHELSHAIVARHNDIPVSRITLFLFGGLAHMEREPPSAKAEFLMAGVGPLTSIVIGLVSILGGQSLAGPEFTERLAEDPEAALSALGPAASLLMWLGPINVLLGVFNMVPGFPLDGGRVFRAILWWITDDLRRATRWASRSGQLFAWILIAWGVFSLLGGGLVQGIWFILIGWFLNSGARMSYQQLVVREALRGISVSTVMHRAFDTVPAEINVESFVSERLMGSDQRAFPVVDGRGRLAGLVCLADVRGLPKDRWPSTPVSEVMTKEAELVTLSPNTPANRALKILGERQVDQLPVMDDGAVVGLVRRQDLMKWISLHLEDDA